VMQGPLNLTPSEPLHFFSIVSSIPLPDEISFRPPSFSAIPFLDSRFISLRSPGFSLVYLPESGEDSSGDVCFPILQSFSFFLDANPNSPGRVSEGPQIDAFFFPWTSFVSQTSMDLVLVQE